MTFAKYFLENIIRIAIEVAILYIVWHHAHWSVAVVLTLLTMNSELQSYLNGMFLKMHKLIGIETFGPPDSK
jgi:hypothetical protein